MSYGVKVSKPNNDVKTASLAGLVFTSEKNLFKIKENGNWQIVLQYDYFYDDIWGFYFKEWQGSTTITHNLGYIPTFEIWGQKPRESSNGYFKWFYERYSWYGLPLTITVYTTSTYLKISYYEATREDLYAAPNRTTLNGVYSFYVDPILT
jgi:hypothetical protein